MSPSAQGRRWLWPTAGVWREGVACVLSTFSCGGLCWRLDSWERLYDGQVSGCSHTAILGRLVSGPISSPSAPAWVSLSTAPARVSLPSASAFVLTLSSSSSSSEPEETPIIPLYERPFAAISPLVRRRARGHGLAARPPRARRVVLPGFAAAGNVCQERVAACTTSKHWRERVRQGKRGKPLQPSVVLSQSVASPRLTLCDKCTSPCCPPRATATALQLGERYTGSTPSPPNLCSVRQIRAM